MLTRRTPTTLLAAVAACAALCEPVHAETPGFVQTAKLFADDAERDDYFGSAVAVSGGTALVGAYGDSHASHAAGSAYLFDVATGQQLFKLTASDAEQHDAFGRSIGISGTTAILGAYRNDLNGPHNALGSEAGAAYLFDTTTGAQRTKLNADDAMSNDGFGISVAISGNTAIVGAYGDDNDGLASSGSAYLFDVYTGAQLAKLTADDAEAWDNFGEAVAISGTTAIVGAPTSDNSAGAAYLFDTTTGSQIAKLTASNAQPLDHFGESVAISGGVAIGGARGRDDATGVALLFDTATGSLIAELTADDALPGDRFGGAVAISGDTAIVGAYTKDNLYRSAGSVYVFDVPSGSQIAKLDADDATGNDYFGRAIALSGGDAVIGAQTEEAGSNSGSAYLFVVPEPASLVSVSLGGLIVSRRRRRV